MRDKEWLHLQIADVKCLVRVDEAVVIVQQTLWCDMASRAMRKPNIGAMLPGKARHTTDMVAVFMGHHYRLQIGWRKTEAPQTHFCFSQAEAAIEHQRRTQMFDDKGVALTAAT